MSPVMFCNYATLGIVFSSPSLTQSASVVIFDPMDAFDNVEKKALHNTWKSNG